MTYYPSVVIDGDDATGTRDAWAALLARLTIGFTRGIPADGSPAWSRLPGADAANPITGMEGFCRMSVAWSAWLAEPGNPDTLDHGGRSVDVLDLVVRGLVDGTDPSGPWYWGDIRDRDQRIVEAAELAFTLWTGRERILPALGPDRLRQVLAWLAQVHGRDVYADNWVLFPAIVATVEPGPRANRSTTGSSTRASTGCSPGTGVTAGTPTARATRSTGTPAGRSTGTCSIGPRSMATAGRTSATWSWSVPGRGCGTCPRSPPTMARSRSWAAPWAIEFATAGPLGLAAMLDQLPIDPGLARGVIDRSIRYHLAHDAIDAATDWFRVGVWGRRPDVCERYMSAGASAWAVRALVPLAAAAVAPLLDRARPGPAGQLVRDPSTPRSTSCCAARATWWVGGPSAVGRGSPRG